MLDVKKAATDYALELGFDLVRVTSAQVFAQDRAITLERLRAGLMDGLPWFNESRVQRGTEPDAILRGARSIISLGMNYYQESDATATSQRPTGRVALYAWGRDYHKVIKKDDAGPTLMASACAWGANSRPAGTSTTGPC